MIKRIITILLVFIGLYFITFRIHQEILLDINKKISFSLNKIYLFHTGFSIIILINLTLLKTVNKISDQIGFIYLGTLLLKIVLFFATFYTSIFKQETLNFTTRISALIPTFIFLLTEVFFIASILKKKV